MFQLFRDVTPYGRWFWIGFSAGLGLCTAYSLQKLVGSLATIMWHYLGVI